MISCLVVDDEPNAVKLMEDHISKIPFLQLKQKCFDAFEVMEYLRKETVDLIFMDIEMPEMSGMELATVLPKNQPIIYTTAYSAYALEGYEFNGLDYLLKPITFKRFAQAATKVQDYFALLKQPVDFNTHDVLADCMFVKSGKQVVKINYESILYFEANKEYVNIVAAEGHSLVYKRMKQLEMQLPVNFMRIHNSYIVNINFMQKIIDNHVLIGDTKLPVSAGYRDKLLSFIDKKMM
ncbi:hypothetical protein OC25_23210 [Pedobacter kyungheensis]|uniref:Chemotaxis protein CheY n=1 Tax=Pedobacter kyungheensis TaxID=1069985 RepID=A0A0C1FGX4_9SPHI|nr:LytTR family DNA-binding domain-containing protein [Pedobacter kyungheensis]KIA91053.1 hypothetical protein OC25_23210 [Pedobacter kyungheensis]